MIIDERKLVILEDTLDSIPKDKNMFVTFNKHVKEELKKRVSTRKCDMCPTEVEPGKGKFWHSGWFLCELCFDKWDKKDKEIRLIKSKVEKKTKGLGDY